MPQKGRLCACAEDDRRSMEGGVARRSTGTARRYLFWKGLLDRLTAAVLLVPGLPLLGLLIVLVRATSRGPGIYRQVRVGKDGREFTMFKLRSMRQDAEAGTGAVWSTSHDNRVTPLGRFLRRSHLDELPQLFNVLWGEMSLIGPRPERPEFVCVLEQQIDGYRDRLAVPPGVTGLAQINLPADTDLASVRRKQVLDLLYIDTASAWLDCRILLCTLARMLGCRGTAAARFLAVHRTVKLAAPPAVAQARPAEARFEPTPDSLKAAAATPPVPQALRQTVTWGDTVEFPAVRIPRSLPPEAEQTSSVGPTPARQAGPKPR